MFSKEFEQFFQKASAVIMGGLTGAAIALIVLQYPGSFEFYFNVKEGSIKLNGTPQCQLIAEMPDKSR